ncbi:glycosyltransferase [Streptomyces sp. ML-6]|uniref:glycosyltransferase n=1 Tax=Streptomyces sp. ML-6 TaxID=2982693 RepID=UPI0024C02799|nr:glycosyltransferase [Streptomyces sp. ML-6]MDK0520539.1 glycosyltransferase [Streptomyces sp. ML-6]
MNTVPGPLVLIEPYAHRGGGHHQRTLTALAAARPKSLVVVPGGLGEDLGPLARSGARIAVGPAGPTARVLLAGAWAAERVSAAGQRAFASRSWPQGVRRFPHQVTLLTRCLTEAACLRTARRLAPQAAAVVILSASEALHGAATLLGGVPHLRFVHEVVTTEDRPVRWLGRLARRGEKRVIALCPTADVRDQVAAAFPRLRGEVRPFAVDDGRRLTDAERSGARAAFTIPADARAVCLVGGWWPYKDIATIDAALARLTTQLHVLVCGTPLDDTLLDRWHRLPHVRLHTVPGPVADEVLRLVYAAADAALVARKPGVGKESGLVMDAARLGVPLVVSAHDHELSARLTGKLWVRLFPAGDPDALAKTLDKLTAEAPARPGPTAPTALDMHPAAEQAAFLTDTYARLRVAKERC